MLRKASLFLLLAGGLSAQPKAKNVILLLADAGGIPTLNAASAFGYGAPQRLYVQSWSHIGLSDTSTASEWVTDSAAGMTAIVTGQKTHNGVISQGPDSVRGSKDGAALKTILEYAEEHGLSTGVLTNVNIADATPAACYAHVNDRDKHGEIFSQLFEPRFGDGVDVVMGVGRAEVFANARAAGKDLDAISKAKGRPVYESLAQVPADAKRPIVVQEANIDLPEAARAAIARLKSNRKGYFLMIEWDAHTDNVERGLTNLVGFDKLIREIAATVNLKDTLLLFTADHSFDLRLQNGLKADAVTKGLRMNDSHTGEEVLVAAQGPGSQRVNGFLPNTGLFQIMMDAYGWKPR